MLVVMKLQTFNYCFVAVATHAYLFALANFGQFYALSLVCQEWPKNQRRSGMAGRAEQRGGETPAVKAVEKHLVVILGRGCETNIGNRLRLEAERIGEFRALTVPLHTWTNSHSLFVSIVLHVHCPKNSSGLPSPNSIITLLYLLFYITNSRGPLWDLANWTNLFFRPLSGFHSN